MAHILLVEDNADCCDALSQLLTRTGHHVDCVPDGRAALSAVLAAVPDLIVLDLMLPGMDGATFLEIIRSYLRLKQIPVLVWTGMIDTPVADRATAFHVEAMIAKDQPGLSELLHAVERTLQQHLH